MQQTAVERRLIEQFFLFCLVLVASTTCLVWSFPLGNKSRCRSFYLCAYVLSWRTVDPACYVRKYATTQPPPEIASLMFFSTTRTPEVFALSWYTVGGVMVPIVKLSQIRVPKGSTSQHIPGACWWCASILLVLVAYAVLTPEIPNSPLWLLIR